MGDNDVIIAKSVAMCVLFCSSMIFGTLPITLSRIFKWNSSSVKKNNVLVQILLCFGGGVLLCTTFLHLLPEVSEKIEELENFTNSDIHYAELLMCTGFFLMYFAEELIHFYLHHRQHSSAALKRSLSLRSVEKSSEDGLSTGPKPCPTGNEHEHSHFDPNLGDDSAVKVIRGLLVVLALSIHELFEGLAVGLESSSRNVWYLFGAVSAHKLVIAFCIGLELVTSGMKTALVVIYVFTFAVVSPLGIGSGIIISGKGSDSTTLPSVILQGFASGTLLYVVFFEILSTERKSGIKQFFAVFVGFLVMFFISFFG